MDGARGDDDLAVNGIITHGPGGPALEQWLRLGDLRLLPNGQTRFALEGVIGDIYQVEASTDLVNWINLITIPSQGNLLDIIDPNTQAFRHRFYRARSVP